MAEAASLLLNVTKAVFNKLCQSNVNREEVAALALHVNLLIGCLSDPDFRRDTSQNRSDIVSQLHNIVRRVEELVDDFASTRKRAKFLWSEKWAQRCEHMNKELSVWIQMLGVENDKTQLHCLNEIQDLMFDRRRHDEDVSEQLRMLRQAVLEVQRLNHNKLQSTLSLKQLHSTLLQSTNVSNKGKAISKRRVPAAVYRDEKSPSLIHEEEPTIAAPSITDVSPRIRDLFEKPEYKFLLLDNSFLTFAESEETHSGAFGVVHTGTYLSQPVAVKILLTKDPSLNAIKEILDEALLLKKYSFDYFATVYGICIVDGVPAIVMKRMDTDLFQFINNQDNKTVTSSMAWKFKTATSMAKAVDALHKLNILHRDLKSPNILIKGEKGTSLCLADFGMAQLRKEVASFRKSATTFIGLGEYETVGSYPWMAPEIMQAGRYTSKADVYSLAVIIWEVFASAEPWADAISIQIIERAVLTGRRLELKRLPEGIAKLLLRMWDKNPKNRPSAAEVASELEILGKKYKCGGHSPVISANSGSHGSKDALYRTKKISTTRYTVPANAAAGSQVSSPTKKTTYSSYTIPASATNGTKISASQKTPTNASTGIHTPVSPPQPGAIDYNAFMAVNQYASNAATGSHANRATNPQSSSSSSSVSSQDAAKVAATIDHAVNTGREHYIVTALTSNVYQVASSDKEIRIGHPYYSYLITVVPATRFVSVERTEKIFAGCAPILQERNRVVKMLRVAEVFPGFEIR